MITPNASRASGDMLSTRSLREPVKVLLSARPEGLGEAMIIHMLRVTDLEPVAACAPAYSIGPDDGWIRKVRQTCKALGARRDTHGVWRLPA